MTATQLIDVRTYGNDGPVVVLIHGGPGAPGHMAPIGRELAPQFRVLEPLQRFHGSEPLTVASHIRDHHEALVAHAASKVHVVGASWGAMLALAFAAAHPETVLSVVLIGCGTFDEISRKLYKDRVESLFDADLRSKIAELEAEQLDPDEALRRKAAIALSAWSHDLITTDFEYTGFDAIGHQETWNDMVRLQVAGVYPQSFVDIMSPVLMLHGSLDPHPGAATRDCLGQYLRRLEYHEWADCGHYPWHERSTRRDFYERLLAWLDVGWQSAHVS